jgi:hypothetical protein
VVGLVVSKPRVQRQGLVVRTSLEQQTLRTDPQCVWYEVLRHDSYVVDTSDLKMDNFAVVEEGVLACKLLGTLA